MNDTAGDEGTSYDGEMEARLAKLESDLAAIKTDLAVIKATGATRTDLAELKGETKAAIADAKASIIVWVVGAVFIAQLLPALLQLLSK
ncbi:hypothetical protein NX774_14670 [Massilia agilis]|uniref:DUF1640 domain-containing protein n=1 Tax=Massilia agilis TaxID=1811226 RepID=A0ABT2DD48_9BURK|nr:hypothetical protein [Massilia agilis]MCS0809171.1 hypothetical protein [Massilia agilis]